ncbi:hypothetical protein ANN_17683 [Periplaneta americana]|uniref:Uncharacterized protein n=1 Tax=Periplaneta americana TaxID=6978 RepID=A0ABQ8SUL2_PERAM|nr:hypothetical protein ANN_17683 [Periplaneta americana]
MAWNSPEFTKNILSDVYSNFKALLDEPFDISASIYDGPCKPHVVAVIGLHLNVVDRLRRITACRLLSSPRRAPLPSAPWSPYRLSRDLPSCGTCDKSLDVAVTILNKSINTLLFADDQVAENILIRWNYYESYRVMVYHNLCIRVSP